MGYRLSTGYYMKFLVTAGNTQVPIDQVRCITNIFTGRTGAAIALEAYQRGHTVTLLTSQPEARRADRWRCLTYRTFDDLHAAMARELAAEIDVLVHAAAVSDYCAAGIFAPAPGTQFRANGTWHGTPPVLIDRAAGKVKSDEPELWLRLVRTPKLADLVRRVWGFRGIFVKFKLEVGIGEADLLERAERSRMHSDADLMVANTLEGKNDWACLGGAAGYRRIERNELAARLLDAIERLQAERSHG